MRFDRRRQLSWVGPTVAVALLTAPVSGAPAGRIGFNARSQPQPAPMVDGARPRTATDGVGARGRDHSAGSGAQMPIVCPAVLAPATWSTKLLGTPDIEYGFAVAVDPDICAIYAGGQTSGSLAGSAGTYDGYLARYGTAGALVWVRQLGSSDIDAVSGIATDSQHNVYVTGWTYGTLPGSPTLNPGGADAFLAKYDQDGTLLWTRHLSSTSDEYALAIAINAADEVYIAGYAEGVLFGASFGGRDYFLARYDASGNQLMVTQRGTSSNDIANAVAVGPEGNVYVAGETSGALAGPSNGGQDLFVGKYDPSGGQIWVRQRGTPSLDWADGVAVNADGQVFVSGASAGGLDGHVNQGFLDIVVLRFNANGTWAWTDQRGSNMEEIGQGIALTSDGSPITTGQTGGSLDGNLSAGRTDLFVMKHGKGGAWRWTSQMGTPMDEFTHSIAVDGADQSYVVGYTGGNMGGVINAGFVDAFAVKYDSAGVLR